MDDGWTIVETKFDPAASRAWEGLFTLGSGRLHVRGSWEEHLSGAPQNVDWMRMPGNVTAQKFPEVKSRWGTYVPGVYGPHPTCNSELINLPWFLELAPVVEGQRLDVQRGDIRHYRRELDLRRAVLSRTVGWVAPGGAELSATFERFVSAVRPGLCLQRMTIRCNRDVTVAVRAGIDADVRTNGCDHFTDVSLAAGERTVDCRVRTDGGDEVFIRSVLCMPGSRRRRETQPRRAALVGEVDLSPDVDVVIEKRSAVCTSRDLTPTTPEAILSAAEGLSFQQLLEEHAAAWAARWDLCDVVIEGDEHSQLAMRASLYHLLRAHVPGDSRVAIDAKGYAGEAYWGRFFWDTEMYLVPFFLYTDPPRARTLVDFRICSLPAARANAASYGYPGAKFPWESDTAGRECCPGWQYRDHEVHVTADVIYAFVHYARATGDAGFLSGPAAETILETARYWLARMDWREGEDHPSLLGVMGPDEYSPLSANNSYTNRLVRLALQTAAEVGAAGGASPREVRDFRRAAEALPIPRRGRLILQSEDFFARADPRFGELWRDRGRGYANNVSQERLYRSKALKQADVLMLMALLPTEFSDEEVRAAWDCYVPLTTHDSSLSAGVHAIVACRLGLTEEAWQLWQRSSGLDLDVAGGGAADGVHAACMASNWMVAVFGFAGAVSAMHTEALTLRPRLPRAWKRLAFPLIWRGCPVHVEITPERACVTNRGQRELVVDICGKRIAVAPGQRVSS